MNAATGVLREHRAVILVILLFTAARLATALFFELSVDEAHYLLYAKHLDLSYFDHPPLVGWVHALVYYTLGSSELLARIPAIIISAFTSILCYRFVLQNASPEEAAYATLALNSSFMFGALGIGLLPETVLLPILLLILFSVQHLEKNGNSCAYLQLGIVLGLAGLSKYTAILFVPAIVIYLLLQRRTGILRNPRLTITLGVALAVISPVIIWNMRNDFISFKYQGEHVAGGQGMRLSSLFQSLGAQFLAYSPPLFCIAFYGFIQSIRNGYERMKLPLLLGGVPLVFFLYASLYKRALPHWNAAFFLLFIPIGTVLLHRSESAAARRMCAFAVWFSVILSLVAYVELAFKCIRFPDYKSPFRDIYGVSASVQKANEILARDIPSGRHKALAVTNWSQASRVLYYSAPFGSEVFLADKRRDQFYLWQLHEPLGYDLLFINTHFYKRDIRKEYQCSAVEEAGTYDVELRGGKVDTISYAWCRNYQGFRVQTPGPQTHRQVSR
jgi:4-amino-4-deoxy-L-arabinose transferase-like glycosyltransferase